MQPSYTQLCSLEKYLFAPGAPLVVVSGTLLQNTQTGQPFVQLLMENIAAVPIVSVKLEVTGLDPADRPLTQPMEHYLMDVNAPRGAQFGNSSLFPMPHPAVRSFSFRVLEVIFADKTIWSGVGCHWSPLPAGTPLEAALQDAELAVQYRLEYGQQCQFAPNLLEDVYLCSCGAVNRNGHPCAHCGATPSAISEDLIAQLREDADVRLAQEAQQAEQARQLAAEQQRLYEEEQARKAAEKQQKKEQRAAKWAVTKKKLVRTAIWSAVILFLVIALALTAVLWVIPEINYQQALKAIQKEDYREAYRLFTVLDDYKDSEEQLSRFLVRTVENQSTVTYSDDAERYDDDDFDDYYSAHEYSKGKEDSYGTYTEYKYDRNGQTVSSSRTSLVWDNGRFKKDGEPEIDDDYAEITYNSAGNPTKRTSGNYSYTYEYDSSNRLVRKEYYRDDKLTGEYTYTYGTNGKAAKIVYKAETYTTTTTCEYNADGKLTRKVSETVYPEDGERNSKSVTTCTYNAAGKLTEEKYVYTSKSSETKRVTNYTYNLLNDLVEYEHRYTSSNYRSSQTYEISYNALGHMSKVEGVYKFQSGEDSSYTERTSAEISCRLDGTMKSAKLKVRYSGDTSNQDYESSIEFDGAEYITSKRDYYDSGKVTHNKYERVYFYFPEGMIMPSEY